MEWSAMVGQLCKELPIYVTLNGTKVYPHISFDITNGYLAK